MSSTKPTKRRKTHHSSPRPIQPAPYLCERCQVLKFDDAAIGGYEYVLDDGRRTLRFKEDALINRYDISKCRKRVDLDYDCFDTLPDLPALAASAKAGSCFCNLLRSVLMKELQSRADIKGDFVQVSLAYMWHSQQRADIWDSEQQGLRSTKHDHVLLNLQATAFIRTKEGSIVERLNFYFGADAQQRECAVWLGLHPPLPSDSLCPENVAWIKQVIQDCLGHHKRRPHKPAASLSYTSKDFLPSRLIDLSNRLAPKLVVLDEQPSEPRPREVFNYAALSYCWGTEKQSERMLKLTNENLQNMLRGDAFVNIPPVVGDTIRVCHKLGIRYLWVDALCIMQGNESEFHAGASQLRSIFEHATVTIVALASSSCNDHYLERNHTTVTIPCQSTVRPEIRGAFTLKYIPYRTIRNNRFHPCFVNDLMNSKWESRGWTYVEQISSNRLLFFGTSMVHYECRDCGYRCETDTAPIYARPQHSFADKTMSQRKWNSIAAEITYRQFTKPTDKLPALSTIAKSVAAQHNDSYIAGIWRGNLPLGLLWTVEPQDTWEDFFAKLSNPCPYIAPTWSWASLNSSSWVDFRAPAQRGVFNLDFSVVRGECNFIDYAADFVEKNPFGAIKRACLSLDGRLAPLPSTLSPSKKRFLLQIYMEDELLGVCQLDWVTEDSGTDDSDTEDGDTSSAETYTVLQEGLMMLLVGSRRELPTGLRVGRLMREEIGAFGLILMPTGIANEYWRVGIFSLLQGGEYPEDPPWNNKLFRGRQKQVVHLV